MIRAIRRWVNRKKPFTCRVCGWTAPTVGRRLDQAVLAFDHWVAVHEQQSETTGDSRG